MRRAAIAVAGLVVFALTRAALAASCYGFTDVDDSNATYCSAVTYLKLRGITVGCGDGSAYCPNDFVTRLQMALFLQRAGKADSTNTIADTFSAVGGGQGNTAGGGYYGFAVVGGGQQNSATGSYAVVPGGSGNAASGESSVVLGGGNNTASSDYAMVLGGEFNVASGAHSIAAGSDATANQDYCALFDLWGTFTGMNCGSVGRVFRVGSLHGLSIDYFGQKADGFGTRFVGIGDLTTGRTIDTWTNAYLSDAGVWTSVSDRAVKQDFTSIDNAEILDRVVHMPVERWRYKAEPQATHIGPVAQDFYAAFNVGADDKHITPIDEGGVALAAIQALATQNQAQAREIEQLKAAVALLMADRAKP